jgi:hypothetical protein
MRTNICFALKTLLMFGVAQTFHSSLAELPTPCAGTFGDPMVGDWSAPNTGDVVGITVVINFSELDTIYPIDMVDIDNFLNQEGYTGHGNNGSVHDYFADVSCGELNYSNYLHPVPYPATVLRSDFQSEPIEASTVLAGNVIEWLDQDQDFNF